MAEKMLSGLKLFNRGKVRDIYDLGDKLLLVASDRISAFDVILPTSDSGQRQDPYGIVGLLVRRDARHHSPPFDYDEYR